MTDTSDRPTTAAPPAADVAAVHDEESLVDERLAYRGVFQRLFIRPEIGAMIGVVGLWVFFWAVSVPFGTAGGTASLVDFASTPLGIMAVAVSMLMVGGEFDLSAGAMTGAMGILVILLSLEAGTRGGAGLNLWIAIPLSLGIALAIGYWNGFLVERTKLPSFIITLGTFFILIGAKLGFSKLIVDQVQVGDIRNASGYDFWRPVFASEWRRNDHQWGQRDTVFLVLILLAIALVVLATAEMQFARRRAGASPLGLPLFGAGLAGVVAGVVVLHQTDGTSGNYLGAAIIAAGTIVGLVGFGLWRFAALGERGPIALGGEVGLFLGLGLAGFAAAIVVAAVMDPYDASNLFFPFTHQGLRATLFLVFIAAGATAMFLALARARRVGAATRSVVVGAFAATLVVMAFFVQSQSESTKFRAEAFSVILAVAMLVTAWLVLGLLFAERDRVHHHADRIGARFLIAAGVLGTAAFLVRLLFTTPDEIEAGINPATFSIRTLWFAGFTTVCVFVLGKTRFGSWTFAVGGNKEAARQVGVPAARTKTQLFMLVSGAAWLVGMLLAFRLNTIQANTGNGEEFEYIIAAVVGGTLLTGGYGTALGGALGAIIIAEATLGIPYARWNSDWRFLFLGVTLLLAVLANRAIRTRAEAMRR
jgi:ribose/xylose/arabinose/galactoside ABC-type transport system permease subunit